MFELQGFQRKFLRGAAHHLKPIVQIGQHGLSENLAAEITRALDDHELIKVKFNEVRERALKDAILQEICALCGCAVAGMLGHTAILFLPHSDPEKRLIELPQRQE